MQEPSPYGAASEPRPIAHRQSYPAQLPPQLLVVAGPHPGAFNAKACPGNSRVLGLPGGSFYPANNTFRKETHILKVFLAKPGNKARNETLK